MFNKWRRSFLDVVEKHFPVTPLSQQYIICTYIILNENRVTRVLVLDLYDGMTVMTVVIAPWSWACEVKRRETSRLMPTRDQNIKRKKKKKKEPFRDELQPRYNYILQCGERRV